jgi:hypothetical protein
MTIFPGGGWDLEVDFPGVLLWLSTLQKLPKSSAATHTIVGVTCLSSAITALSLTVFPTNDKDNDEDEDNDKENDALDDEEMPAAANMEKIAKDKGKGQEVANPGNEEKAMPVSLLCHRGSIANHSACSVIAVSWPSANALGQLANLATANVARLKSRNARMR